MPLYGAPPTAGRQQGAGPFGPTETPTSFVMKIVPPGAK